MNWNFQDFSFSNCIYGFFSSVSLKLAYLMNVSHTFSPFRDRDAI